MATLEEIVEEFFNHTHSAKTGQFASGRPTSGAGKGLFSIARTSKTGAGKIFKIRRKPPTSAWNHHRTLWSSGEPQMSPLVEELYNHVHGKGGRFATGRASSGRAGFREGSHTGKGRATTVMASPGLQRSSPQNLNILKRPGKKTHFGGGPADRHKPGFAGYYIKVGKAPARKPVGERVKHTEVSPGEVYTSLKGSHTIRKTASGKFVLHTKNAAPQVVSKAGAAHVKKLDQHKPTTYEDIAGRIARWKSKG